jgi:hypothetical protein
MKEDGGLFVRRADHAAEHIVKEYDEGARETEDSNCSVSGPGTVSRFERKKGFR